MDNHPPFWMICLGAVVGGLLTLLLVLPPLYLLAWLTGP